MNAIRIATRGSKLALAQANEVRELLFSKCPELSISIVEISTKGDRDKSDFLYKSGSVGFFTSEVEKALLDGRADIAVHSLKDLPTAMTERLVIAAIPQRQVVNDAIITSEKISSIDDLPKGATVGTSSVRRISQLKLLRPDLDCQPLRGNIETRIRKVQEDKFDAIVIAAAGINRLGLSDKISLVLDTKNFIPCPGQGALAIQVREDDIELCQIVSQLDDLNARTTAETERQILTGLHGGCSIPLGVHSHIERDIIHIHAILCNLGGTKQIKKAVSCPIGEAAETARSVAQQILNEGGRKMLQEIRRQKNL